MMVYIDDNSDDDNHDIDDDNNGDDNHDIDDDDHSSLLGHRSFICFYFYTLIFQIWL